MLTSPKPPTGVNPQLVSNWISGGGKVEAVPQDKDVFGDGTVVMLYTPGHTPGHHSLLVKLAQMGPVILSGYFVHFHGVRFRSGELHWTAQLVALAVDLGARPLV